MATNKLPQAPEKEKTNAAIREKVVHGSWGDFQNLEGKKASCLWPTFTELKNLIIFLFFNLAVLLVNGYYPTPPETLTAMLGMAPPLLWVNIACLIYFFTEFILTLCRERKVNSDRFALKQLLFMAAFYLFYWYVGVLQQHFALLLIGGSALQLLEAFARKNPLKRIAEEN